MTEFYWGYAKLDSEPAPVGTEIIVVVDHMVDNISEVVGSTKVMEDGAFTLDIYFDDPDTIDDEGAMEGDILVWYMENRTCNIPSGSDTASAWRINNQDVAVYDGSPFNISAITRLEGDITGDGVVDYEDILVLATAYDTMKGDEDYVAMADLDGNGKMGYGDILILATNYGKEI